MLTSITPFLQHLQPRAIVPYQTFLKAQLQFIRRKYLRLYEAQGHENAGVRLIRYVLQFVDMEYLDRQVNNYDRYLYHLRFIRKDLNEIFDRVQRGRGYRNLFMRHRNHQTEEFVIPIEDLNAIVNLPLDTNDWAIWKRVRPLRLWWHDSQEFTINILNDRIRFRQDVPRAAVFLLDVVALTLKYWMWYHYQRQYETAQELAEYIPQQLFIHKYVICPLLTDLTNVWLLSQLNEVLKIESRDALESWILQTNESVEDPEYGHIVINYRQGMESIWDLVNSTKRNLLPESLLSSALLVKDTARYGRSLNDRIRQVDETLPLPVESQYDWLRYLRDRDTIRLFIQIWRARPDLPKCQRIHKVLSRMYNRVLLRKPWRICQSRQFKSWLEADMTQTVGMVDLLLPKI